jgi:pentafunctional AROM polypeptide
VKPNLAANLTQDKRTYFLSLTYPDVRLALDKVNELTAGVDAVELRVDLLRAPGHANLKGNYIPPTPYVVEQLALLRRRTTLPIVFTVRSVTQGGSHPDGAENEAFALFEVGRRMGCEYIDVEISWNESQIREFAQRKGHSQIIASWHDWSGKMKWNSSEVNEKYEIAHSVGDIVKIVGRAMSFEDNFALRSFVGSVKQRNDVKPMIAINTGYEGQLSRILNTTLSPVTHPLLSVSAAPGQLSFAQIQHALHLMGLLPAKKFYLFGMPIAKSPSPTLHNTIFGTLGLPYEYELFETDVVDERIQNVLQDPTFGGASVTIPHKVAIIPLLDQLTEHAKMIGAVNTVVPLLNEDGTRALIGDNTDWLGILNTVKANLSNVSVRPTAGLVIGAGGTSRAALYALHKLGLSHIYLFNRTRSSAEGLASEFPSFNIEIVDSLASFSGPRPTIIVSTVPGQAFIASNDSQSGMIIPPELFDGECGVAVDMAYIPKETALLSAAAHYGWRVVYGVQVLLEQGYHQCSAWTGRQPPRAIATSRVREQWLNANVDTRK